MQHFDPSFERRLGYLLAVLILVSAGQLGSWQSGLYMALMVMFFAELFELVFGKGYAFEILPFDKNRDKTALDYALHPVMLAGFSLAAAMSLISPSPDLVYVICVLVVALASLTVYHLKGE